MAVLFSGNTIEFTTSYFSTLTEYTVLAWIKVGAYNVNSSRFWSVGETSTSKLVYFGLDGTASEIIFFSRPNGTSNPGSWATTTDPAPIDTVVCAAVTYNNTSTSNDPIIYVNGASQSIVENAAPATSGAIATANYCILSRVAPTNLDATLYSVLVYNRILSAAEILDAYNSKLAIPSWRGLVFAPQLWNVQDGAVLGSSNIIRDLVSGAAGVPSGSPVGRGDNVLRIEGIN